MADEKKSDCYDQTDVLIEEEQHLIKLLGEQPWEAPPKEAGMEARLAAFRKRRHSMKRLAFAASGGGIRSACINLGVAQGLAGKSILRRFHYLSSVSGGGYFGSWLSTWIKAEKDQHHQSVGTAASIEAPLAERQQGKEAEPIHNLRVNSNYLTPRVGVLSVDFLTCVMIIPRNMIVNWLVLIPFFALCLAVPVMVMRGAAFSARNPLDFADDSFSNSFSNLAGLAGCAAILLMLLNAFLSAYLLPGFNGSQEVSQGRHTTEQISSRYQNLLYVKWGCTLVAALCLSVWFKAAQDSLTPKAGFVNFLPALLAIMLPYLVGTFRFISNRRESDGDSKYFPWARAASGFLFGMALVFVATYYAFPSLLELGPAVGKFFHFSFQQNPFFDELPYFAVAPALWIALIILTNYLMVGCSSKIMSDEDREWWARSNASLALLSSGWFCCCLIAALGPFFLPAMGIASAHYKLKLGAWLTAQLGAGGLLAKLSASPNTPGSEQDQPTPVRTALLHAGALLFFLILALLLAAANYRLAGLMGPRAWSWAVLTVAWGAIAALASWTIDINQFSLHCLYRNRLLRAFIGGVRRAYPRGNTNSFDAFTGFDTNDNYDFADLQHQLPFHVINISQNLIRPTNLAWQERMAASFTVSPLHAGGSLTNFRKTSQFGQGISIGTAVATSGAAANPSMGYCTSPILALLMTLFNVRLGWWVGNPNVKSAWKRIGPQFALQPLLSEMFGQTSEGQEYVLLSDGGHFEDLGVYEMVRRRCHFILVVDAGADPTGTFEDLGNAVRKVRIDFGISIDFIFNRTTEDLAPKTTNFTKGELMHFAAARINYQDADGKDAVTGWILYLKGCLTGDEPTDIYEYKRFNNTFPHQSTMDQWFDESQFESYRALGQHSIEHAIKTLKDTNMINNEDITKLREAFL